MSVSVVLNEELGIEQDRVSPRMAVIHLPVWRELARNLWLALGCLFLFAWFRECPSYCGYLFGMLVEPVQLSFWGEASLAWLVLAKSAQALVPVAFISFWLTSRHRVRLGRYLLSGWVSLLILWLFVDQIVFVISSHHAFEYLSLVVIRDTWQWAGESSKSIGLVVMVGCYLLAAVSGLFEIAAWLDLRLYRCASSGRGLNPFMFGSFALLFVVMLGWPLPRMAMSETDSRLVSRIERNLAWRPIFCEVDHKSGLNALPELRNRASRVYANMKERLRDQPLDDRFRVASSERKHVVLLVLESFRRDLISPETMPFCEKLSHEALFFERHYSNSNMSHYGLFSLLYGRLPFVYDELLDRHIKPQASEMFRNSGYRNTFITSGDCSHWMRMGEFLDRGSFDELLICQQQSWVERDRQAMNRVKELLKADPQTHPQFIVCFLVATHFPYEFPPEFQRFEPVAKVKDVLAAQNPSVAGNSIAMKNRQRNSANFLDSEIQQLVTSMDRSQTMLVVTGDHAESFRDDGCYFHGSRLSDAQTMVPALFWGEGIPPQRIQRMTSHVDILPTLSALLTSGRDVVDHGHGHNVLAVNPSAIEQVLLVHGRMTTRDLFQRAVLVSPELRLPMLLHSSKGGGVTLLDPVDATDRTLPSQSISEATINRLAVRIEAAFRTLEQQRLVSALNVQSR